MIMANLTMTHTSGMRRGIYVIGKKNSGRGTMSRTRWVSDWNTIALHARKMSWKSLVGERMREKPQVSSLDKMFCSCVAIGL